MFEAVHSVLAAFATHQYCKFGRIQLGAQWIDKRIDAEETLTLPRRIVGFVKCNSFGYVKLPGRKVLYGCLWCKLARRLMLLG